MTLSKRGLLYISLALIVVHWTWQLLDHPLTPVIPATFSELARKILINKSLLFAIMVLLLLQEEDGWAGVGLRSRGWGRQLAVGLGLGFVMFLVFNAGLPGILDSIFPKPPARGPSVMMFFAEWKNLLIWLPIGIFGGGVVEELERIFVLTRFEQWLGRPGLVFAVIVTSTLFGVGHLYQGVGSALSTGLSALVFSALYIRRRSAIELMTAHAFSDVLAILGAAMMAQSGGTH